MNQIQIEMDIPREELWANKNTHWRAKAPIAKSYRGAAGLIMCAEMLRVGIKSGDWTRARLSCEFLFCDKRKRDCQNALQAIKPGVDGVVDAGLIPDDDWTRLEIGRVIGGIDVERPRVIMSFERIE